MSKIRSPDTMKLHATIVGFTRVGIEQLCPRYPCAVAVAPGSCRCSLAWAFSWLTARRRLLITTGFFSSVRSRMRPAPTLAPSPNSSISMMNLLPFWVNGSAYCGVLTLGQVVRLMTGTCGLSTRFWIWVVSRMTKPLKSPDSAMYSRLPSSLRLMPCDRYAVVTHRSLGTTGSATSIAATDRPPKEAV